MTKKKAPPGTFEPFKPSADSMAATIATTSSDDGFQPPFRMTNTALCRVTRHGDEERETVIAQNFTAIARCKDLRGLGWGVMINFKDRDGNLKAMTILDKDLVNDRSDVFSALADAGLRFDYNKKRDFKDALVGLQLKSRILSLHKPGWVSPGGVYVDQMEILYPPPDGEHHGDRYNRTTTPAKPTKKNGTLASWRTHVCQPCIGNSRFVLAICAAFAGPVLKILGSEGFAINLRGATSSGKSTALLVALSIGATPHNTWQATGNAIEGIAEEANDGLLALDELSLNVSVNVGEILYMVCSGQGKARADKNGNTKDRKTWTTVLISTGELTLDQKMKEANSKVPMRGGQDVRFVDIEADAGCGMKLFERLPDDAETWNCKPDERPKEFSKRLRRAAEKNCGFALPEYVRALQLGFGEAFKTLHTHIAVVLADQFPALNAEGGRVLDSFVTMAASGEFATEQGITGWEKGEAIKAAIVCFTRWL